MTTIYAEDVRGALVGIFERLSRVEDEYDFICEMLKNATGQDLSDWDASLTPLTHALYCLCDRLGYSGRDLDRMAEENIRNGDHTAFTNWKWEE